MKNRNIFRIAANGLHMLSKEGLFGENSANQEIRRESMDSIKYIIELLEQYFAAKNNPENILEYEIFKKMYKIFLLAGNKEGAEEILLNFMGGDNQSCRFECMSAYSESVIAHEEYITYLKTAYLSRKTDGVTVKKISGHLFDAYSKNTELSGKFMGCLICLLELGKGMDPNVAKINNYSIYQKMIYLEETGEYAGIIKGIDNKIRNAEAHVTYSFDIEKMEYCIRDNKGTESIMSFLELADNAYPQLIAFNSAFLYCVRLFSVQKNDFKTFLKLLYKM